MQIDKSTIKKLAALVAGGILLHWLLQNIAGVGSFFGMLGGFLFPFILGFILAFLLNIPMKFIERVIFRGKIFRFRRIISYVLALVFVLAVITVVVFLVVPQLVSTVSMLIKTMPEYVARMQIALEPYHQYIPQLQSFIDGLKLDWNSIGIKLFALLQNGAGSFFSSALGMANSLLSGASSFLVGFIFSVYLLLDKEHLCAQLSAMLRAYLPEKHYNKLYEITALSGRIFSKFVSGQCIEGVAIGSVFAVVLWIGGFDYSLLIGVLIGFLSLIPIFGAFIGCAVGALLILVSSGMWRALAFVILFIVIQQLDGNFMYPRIVGNSVGLPAVWVLVAVTIGAGLMGITGMLFFIPLCSVFYALLRKNTLKRLEEKGISVPLAHRPPKTEKKTRKKP